jgi:ABC-type glycerol-3-phosphate transport system substrate-binding protein
VKKWDAQALKGDFVIGLWPKFEAGRESAVVIGGMRGVAIPENSPNLEEAKEFAAFMLTKDAQKASLENVGAAVRGDFPLTGLSERRMIFAKAEYNLNAYDFPESIQTFYPQLEAEYHRLLLDGIANPPKDWKAFIAETAKKLRAKAKELQ